MSMLAVSMEDGSESTPESQFAPLRERRKLGADDGADDNFHIFDTRQPAETLSSLMGLPALPGAAAAISLWLAASAL